MPLALAAPLVALLAGAAGTAGAADGAGAADAAEAPRAVVRAYLDAVLRGDADAALALVAAPTEADRVAVRASAASEDALRRVEEVATGRFGPRGELGVAARHARLRAAVDAASVEVAGERAVVRPEGERPFRLRRVHGAWRLASPAERLTGPERRALRRAVDETEAAARDVAERIRSSAVRTAEEARAALRRALGKEEPEGVPL